MTQNTLDAKGLEIAHEAAEAAYLAEEHEGLAFDGAVTAGIRAYLAALREAPAPSEEPVAWCQPMDCGKHTPRKFIVRFEDADKGDAIFDDEAEARDYWERANGNWNCYLFGALPRVASPAVAPVAPAAVLDKLLSCVCLLEVMADSAKERDDEVEWAMMSVMAKDGREVLNGYQSE